MKNLILLLTTFLLISCSSEKQNSQLADLTGEWKLISFVDEANSITQIESDFENSNEIIIGFNEDFNYEGNTLLNEFFGTYSLNNSETVLIFLEFNTTEANETDWGSLFYDKLNLNYNLQTQNFENGFELNNNSIKLYYAEFEYMVLEKI